MSFINRVINTLEEIDTIGFFTLVVLALSFGFIYVMTVGLII
jgi:hypothetical protein